MRRMNIQYYVEGECEKKLINVLKSDLGVIKSGKVQKLNVVQNIISDAILRTLSNGTTVVLVFDTDTENLDILNKNIEKLKACSFVSKIITIPQVPNLEEELVRSCKVKKITELLNSSSKREFKSDMIRVSNLHSKLKKHEFDIKLFWSQQSQAPYQGIVNDADKIKIISK